MCDLPFPQEYTMSGIALSPLRLEVATALRNDMLPLRRPNLPSVFYDLLTRLRATV